MYQLRCIQKFQNSKFKIQNKTTNLIKQTEECCDNTHLD